MRVMMLGWEFPPFITGGLGTACFGLTKAMDRRGMNVTFVLPKSVANTHAEHVDLVSPQMFQPPPGSVVVKERVDVVPGEANVAKPNGSVMDGPAPLATTPSGSIDVGGGLSIRTPTFERVSFVGVPAEFSHAYGSGRPGFVGGGEATLNKEGRRVRVIPAKDGQPAYEEEERDDGTVVRITREYSFVSPVQQSVAPDYGSDLMQTVERYASFCVQACRHMPFDVIHAHDWLTYPAGLALAQVTGKPLVVHVHSTEFDRSGVHVNQRIYDIERRGMHGAMRVITVSMLTKNVCVRRYSVPESKIEVVYNGVDIEPTQPMAAGIQSKDKIVLYFGRITYQKGPEYFIKAARRVLEYMDNVKFVVAGSGDQAARMIEMAAHEGIGHKVLFTGFLRGKDIQRVFAIADLYVMPSVSEPFGIAPLEAMANDVPALISKTSGVSEVLVHALKTDFWDIEDMANKIIAVLRHPPLQRTLQEHGSFEVRKITWDGAASRCERIYNDVVHEMTHRKRAAGA